MGGDKWGLQRAIADTYGEFFDKNETLNIWSRELYHSNDIEYTVKLSSMIRYAVKDCLAYTMGEDIGSIKLTL